METQLRGENQRRYTQIKGLTESQDLSTFQAYSTERSSPVILKELRLGHLSDWKTLSLFEREARLLAHLNHPQIPALLDYFSQDTEGEVCFYLVSEWIAGQTLATRLKSHWLPRETEAVEIALQILEILIYLQNLNPPVIHRDLKPSNLIQNPENKIFLIDFGAVQELLRPTGEEEFTLIGTPGYAAPEQFTGRALPQSDLYGLGTSLVHLLTGRNPLELPRKQGKLQYRGFTQCSLPFLEWLDYLLCPDPLERFPDAQTAFDTLNRLYPGLAPPKHTPAPPKTLPAVQMPRPQPRAEKTEKPASLQPGQLLFGKYQVGTLLNRGTRSQVYLAQRLQPPQEVILKVLSLKQVHVWKELELFRREADALRQLKHPQIPKLLEFIEESQDADLRLYLLSEKVQGESLSEKLAKGWRPESLEVWNLADQLLEILVYLQSLSPAIVHRDIKPSNLVLDPDQKLWLIDFGAVNQRFRSQGGSGSTLIGTAGYMAPEQFAGKALLQSDLYALGATLVHLLSGLPPAELPQQDFKIQFEAVTHCNQSMQQWLGKLLEPDPHLRYESAQEARLAFQYARNKASLPVSNADPRLNTQLPKIRPGTPPGEICKILFKELEYAESPSGFSLFISNHPLPQLKLKQDLGLYAFQGLKWASCGAGLLLFLPLGPLNFFKALAWYSLLPVLLEKLQTHWLQLPGNLRPKRYKPMPLSLEFNSERLLLRAFETPVKNLAEDRACQAKATEWKADQKKRQVRKPLLYKEKECAWADLKEITLQPLTEAQSPGPWQLELKTHQAQSTSLSPLLWLQPDEAQRLGTILSEIADYYRPPQSHFTRTLSPLKTGVPLLDRLKFITLWSVLFLLVGLMQVPYAPPEKQDRVNAARQRDALEALRRAENGPQNILNSKNNRTHPPQTQFRQPSYQTPQTQFRQPSYQAPQTQFRQPSYQAPQTQFRQPSYQAPQNQFRQPSYQAPQNQFRQPTYQAPQPPGFQNRP